MDLYKRNSSHISRSIEPEQLLRELDYLRENGGPWLRERLDQRHQSSDSILRAVVMVEDLTPNIVESLGITLDIDPLFFASHIDSLRLSSDGETPDNAILPSRRRPRQYLNIHYHQAFIFNSLRNVEKKQLTLDANLARKFVPIMQTKKGTIALARRCVSVLRARWGSFWIGLVLTDRPVTDEVYDVNNGAHTLHKLPVQPQPWLGGYEGFQDPSFSVEALTAPRRNSMMDELLYYWNRQLPANVDNENNLVLALSYYPLKIVAAEWMIYGTLMNRTIKNYEYASSELSDLNIALEKLNSDLKDLQSWRRRSVRSQHKINMISIFLRAYDSPEAQSLQEDYAYVFSVIGGYSRLLESTIPLVISFVQIIDSRRDFTETTNISRLTMLALIFVPLTFISSLFSMNPENAPGSHYFWVYFAVAIPVMLLVCILARPPGKLTGRSLFRYVRKCRGKNLP
ncbi:MAG: hypothetical protein M1821_005127 [Bathelium mastoideum]|nr:MAG: hypothetical protein M1821_005127 [Bathelium mastoideum]